jgi:hypothetical protein
MDSFRERVAYVVENAAPAAKQVWTYFIITQIVNRAPPLIPQQLRGIIEAKRSQSLDNESCDRSAAMMPRTCCRIKGGARFTNCVKMNQV